MSNQFCYSYDNEQFHGHFDSREQALAEARSGDDTRTVYVGESVPYEVEDFVSADGVLYDLRNRACDEAGEWADDWLGNVTPEQEAELQALLVAWVRKVDSPSFYRVPCESVTTHTAKDQAP